MTNQIMFIWKEDDYAEFFNFNSAIRNVRYKNTRPFKLVIGKGEIDDITNNWLDLAKSRLTHDGEIIFEETLDDS